MLAKHMPSNASSFRSNRILLFGGMAVLVAVIVAVAAFTLVQLHAAEETRADASAKRMAQSVTQTFDGLIGTVDVALQSSVDEIERDISAGTANAHSISSLLTRQQKRLDSTISLRGTNHRGDIRYGSEISSPSVNISDREYFNRVRNNSKSALVISEPLVSRTIHDWVWIFAQRINKPDGSFGGMIYAVIPVKEIHKMFSQITIDHGNIIALRNENMGLVARYVSPDKFYTPSDDKGLSIPFTSALKANQQNGSYQTDSSRIDGISRMFSYQRSAKHGFIVNVGITHEAAFAEWRKQAWIVGGLVFVFALALLAFARRINSEWIRQDKYMAALQASKESLDEAQHIACLGRSTYDLRTDQWTSSDILDDIFGIGPDYQRDVNGWLELVAIESRQEMQAYLNKTIEQKLPFEHEYRIIRHNDGQARWVHHKGRVQLDADGKPLVFVSTIQDITAHKKIEESLRESEDQFRTIADSAQDAIIMMDAEGSISFWNPAYCKISGYTREELLTLRISDLEAMESDFETENRIQYIAKHSYAQFETRHRRKDGSIWNIEASITYRNVAGGQVLAFLRDISERKLIQKELHQIATTDDLTGLMNRRYFMELAQNEHRRAIRLHHSMAIALIDLDRLKQINDTHGHAAGDLVLQKLTHTVQQNIREIDMFARLGGDEFVLLLPGASSKQAYEVLERACQALAEYPLDYDGQSISISLSAGIASISSDDDTFEILMSRADQALYQSKAAGRNQVTIDHDLM